MPSVSAIVWASESLQRGITPEPRFYDTPGMDEETAYENRSGRPYTPDPSDLVEDLHARCQALRRQLGALQPQCMEEARQYDMILGEIEELASRIVAIEEGRRG